MIMDDVIDITGGVCVFCHKRPATRLCDAPVGMQRFCGHPPRSLAIYLPDRLVWEISPVITCDKPMCEECAIEIVSGIDYCPRCIERIKKRAAEKGKRKEK